MDSRKQAYNSLLHTENSLCEKIDDLKLRVRKLSECRAKLSTQVSEDGMSCCYWCGNLIEQVSENQASWNVCGNCIEATMGNC